MPLAKHYHVNNVDGGDKPLEFNCQGCNGFVKCSGKSGELIYITLFRAFISTLGLHPKNINPKNCFFQWSDGTKIHCIY